MKEGKFRPEAFLKEKHWKKLLQKENLVVVILSGVLLLLIAWPSAKKEEPDSDSLTDLTLVPARVKEEAAEAVRGKKAVSSTGSLEAYEDILEQRLCELLEGIKGVGTVRVMVTLASSEEEVIEKDRPVSRINTTEQDGAGGNRSIYETENGESTVYRSAGNESTPYVVKTLMPKVEGVAVVAGGAGTGEISKQITEAVQALFALEAHKIKVIPGK